VEQTRVRELIRAVLEAAGEFDGRSELLLQVDYVEATGSATWMNLTVRPGPAASSTRTNPIPGKCWAYDCEGEPIGSLVVWTTGGWLSDLELGWVSDVRPTELPDPSLVGR
jgi:hypothetical protein